MVHNVVAPSVGESITEVTLLKWHKKDGDPVKNGEMILEIESDKATVEIIAESNGAIKIVQPEGSTVHVGETVATIDDSKTGTASASISTPASKPTSTASAAPKTAVPSDISLSPAVRKAVVENNIDPARIQGTGKDGRITKGDVIEHVAGKPGMVARAPETTPAKAPVQKISVEDGPGDRRVPMSSLRKRIAQRLVQAQQTAAILTTFNEVDMKPVMDVRRKYKDSFKAKYGVGLGFMSFFTRACSDALKELPGVNAFIDGDDIIYHDYANVGVAVGTERGLVVPVLKNAQNMTFVEIERTILTLAEKARAGKLGIADMSGGTFTISNGGVYGSLLSTPILNPPQSAILGMHSIQERPVVKDGQIVIRPMMNLALSYDHRLIDGKEAVTFLIKVKERLESPENLKMEFTNEL